MSCAVHYSVQNSVFAACRVCTLVRLRACGNVPELRSEGGAGQLCVVLCITMSSAVCHARAHVRLRAEDAPRAGLGAGMGEAAACAMSVLGCANLETRSGGHGAAGRRLVFLTPPAPGPAYCLYSPQVSAPMIHT